MKFFATVLLVALVACSCSANEEAPASKLEAAANPKEIEPAAAAAEQGSEAQARGKRGFLVGAYSAPLTAAVGVAAAPAYTAAYTAPVAYTYGAALPYAYRPYASYYSYPTVYV